MVGGVSVGFVVLIVFLPIRKNFVEDVVDFRNSLSIAGIFVCCGGFKPDDGVLCKLVTCHRRRRMNFPVPTMLQ